MRQIVRLFVVSLIAILISSPLLAGGHDYVPYPVIFVHGFNADMGSWSTTKQNLGYLYSSKYGFASEAQYFPEMNYGAQKLGDFSKNGDCTYIADKGNGSLKAVIDAVLENSQMTNLPPEERKVIIVAHSFGGLVTRALLKQDPSMQNKIAKVIFVGTPHQGSPLASVLWLLKEAKPKVEAAIAKYSDSNIPTGAHHTCSYSNTSLAYNDMWIQLQLWLIEIKTSLLIANPPLYINNLTGLNIDPYGKAIEQTRLNRDVSLSKSFNSSSGGLHEDISVSYTGTSTFLGNPNNLAIPQKYSTIYGVVNSQGLTGTCFPLLFNLALHEPYFNLPPSESFHGIADFGDTIVSMESQRLEPGQHQEYPIIGSNGVHASGEALQYDLIKKVLCEDPPDTVFAAPLSNIPVYTTRLRVEGKIRDYLPIDNTIKFILNNHKDISFDYPERKTGDPDTKFDLNPDYNEAGPDNYQGTYATLLNLFPFNNQAYDSDFALYAKAVNPGGKESALKDINFTYTCLVSTHSPVNNEQNVDLTQGITVTFKEKIRRETFISPKDDPLDYTFVLTDGTGFIIPLTYSWYDEYTVLITPDHDLTSNMNYTLRLLGDNPDSKDNFATPDVIENLSGIEYYLTDPNDPLHLDRHGFDPDYKFTFKTVNSPNNSYTFSVAPRLAGLAIGDTVIHDVILSNITANPITIDLNQQIHNVIPGLSVGSLSSTQVTLSGGQSQTISFSVTNTAAISGGTLIEITASSNNQNKRVFVYDWASLIHYADHPDETYEVTSAQYGTPWQIDTQSNIGILLTGWSEGIGQVLSLGGIKSCPVTPEDFQIISEPERKMNDLKVLVIGSGGLSGNDNSPAFKQKLADYVSQGGTIICFTQQHGYEFNALPGDGVSGYGWSEDQSCFTDAVTITSVSPVFNGQTQEKLTVNVDGFFTKWPAAAKILFSRYKNGMPSLLEYNYGNGKVIVSTLYSDWGYGHGQTSQDEQVLIKQLISYALDPAQLPTQSLGGGAETKDLVFAVSLNKDSFARGEAGVFVFHIYNNGQQDREVKLAHYGEHLHSPNMTMQEDGVVTAKAGEHTTVAVTVPVGNWPNSSLLYGYFTDSQTNGLIADAYYPPWGYFHVPVYIYDPQVKMSITTDKSAYGKDDQKAILTVNAMELPGQGFTGKANIRIANEYNQNCFSQEIDVALGAKEEKQYSIEYPLATEKQSGNYMVSVEALNNGGIIGSGATFFAIPKALMTITPVMPAIFGANNHISF